MTVGALGAGCDARRWADMFCCRSTRTIPSAKTRMGRASRGRAMESARCGAPGLRRALGAA